MKVVINRCYGGFGLSPKGEAEYMKRKGKDLYFYEQTKFRHEGGNDEYVRVDEPTGEEFMLHTVTVDAGKVIEELPLEHYCSCRDINRDDPDLIAVVEKLGRSASGRHAGLEVIEIPDGIEWEVEEYDGIEWIAEKRRVWP